ncbi:polysaccharide deacetylase family protein [Myxacorys almedinensis]|uniref:Polysaccharide deacetylase family protein n=1 Tax=Myxacorys almedinensis A TaxID=2690445 RepID=A0A8J8CK05_9CYAN|nr:polysaccharide deacetylase family protein [Myxacorys almedinensis]NDJ18096.1 polysaccharide deacetylase family protein [Myxacorys almedinensis A]
MTFARLYPLLHRVLKPTFPHCLWSGRADSPAIALTFDDGPHPKYTPQLLDVLDHHKVCATFFWLGACVEAYPDLARQIYQRGHWIGLHSYHHRAFTSLSATDLKTDLAQTRAAIAKTCQINPNTLIDVRPPYGLFTPQTLNHLHHWNYRTVMWSIIPEDWVCPGASIVVQRVVDQVQNGSIIVLHDGDSGGRDVAETVDSLIPRLVQSGYQFSTINQIWLALPHV